MNTKNLTTWSTFKGVLQQNPELRLQFQFAPGEYVDAAYHITEIKQAPIVSVDCGGVMNSWTEVIIQLWEPAVKDSKRAMLVNKALSIIDLVEKSLPLHPGGIVKIEYGNARFDTRQMYPQDITVDADELIVNLAPDFTQCKAIGRGETCETETTPNCTPGSGCC